MLNQKGKVVKALIKEDRTFIPFRALGEVLGVTIDWDNGPPVTGYYNKGAYKG